MGLVPEADRVDELTRLALAAGSGDRRSQEAFVRRTQAEVWRLCAHLGDPEHADDLTQDTYLRALPALERFRADASARTWLLGIARRACADDIRRRQRRRALDDRARSWDPPGTTPGPEESVGLDALLAELDGDRREAFVLTQVIGLSYDAAAETVGCPVGTIRSRVARARVDLAGALDDRSDEATRDQAEGTSS